MQDPIVENLPKSLELDQELKAQELASKADLQLWKLTGYTTPTSHPNLSQDNKNKSITKTTKIGRKPRNLMTFWMKTTYLKAN